MTYKAKLSRRELLKTSAAAGAITIAAPSILHAGEPGKPKELIIRAWGGPWVEALKNGVSDPLTDLPVADLKVDVKLVCGCTT